MALVALLLLAVAVDASDNATNAVSRGSKVKGDMKELDKGVFTESTKWHKLLTPGPAIVTALASVLVVASQRDFNLSEPEGGFKIIKDPSFRKTMGQVNDEIWAVFSLAHRNMDVTQIYMKNVPVTIKVLKRIFREGTPSQKARLPKRALGQIQSASDNCVAKVDMIVTEFNKTTKLLEEVELSTFSAQSVQGGKVERNKMELELANETKESLEEYRTRIQARLKKFRNQKELLLKKCIIAYANIPGEITIFFRGVVKLFLSVGQMFVEAFDLFEGDGNGGIKMTTELTNVNELVVVVNLKTYTTHLGKVKDQLTQSIDEGTTTTAKTAFTQLKEVLEVSIIQQMENLPSSDLKTKSLNLIKTQGMGLYDSILKEFGEESPGSNVKADLTNSIEVLEKSIEAMIQSTETGKKESKQLGWCTDNLVPELCKAQLYSKMYAVVAQQEAEMKKTEQELQKRLDAIISRISKLKFNEVDFKQVLDIIAEALGYLTDLHLHWSTLQKAFVRISSKTTDLAEELEHLTGTVKVAVDTAQFVNEEGKNFTKEDIAVVWEDISEQTDKIERESKYLYMVSSSYVDISSKHILNRLLDMPGLTNLKSTSKEKAKTILLQLAATAKRSNDEIKKYFQRRYQEYEDYLKKFKVANEKKLSADN